MNVGAYAIAVVVLACGNAFAESWRGLVVEPENRCSPYKASAYRYPQTADTMIVERLGWKVDKRRKIGGKRNVDYGKLDNSFPSPYVPGIAFRYIQDMDIEHIVPRSEAHDSGLCATPERWTPFASDPLNLTVSAEHVNRTLKSDREPDEWMPDINRCWYAETWMAVKVRYGLSVDGEEKDALSVVLDRCEASRQ